VLAQAKDSPLALVDCAPPRSITQTRVSIDEVTLQLAVSCRLDVPAARAGKSESGGTTAASDQQVMWRPSGGS
jgi:hypothetical protein